MIIFLVASASVDGYLADRGAESDHNCIRICHMCLHIRMISHNSMNEIVNTVYTSHIRREVSLETLRNVFRSCHTHLATLPLFPKQNTNASFIVPCERQLQMLE